jgi:hypothetical protein
MRFRLFAIKKKEMIANRISHWIVEIILSFYQDIEHDAYNHYQYRFQNIQSFVWIFEKSKISICAQTCDMKKKFNRRSQDDRDEADQILQSDAEWFRIILW